mgnify:CR=1 FL=1
MGRSILKFSAEVVPRCPFGPKTAKKWKTPPPKCVTFDFTLIGGGREQAGWAGPRQKLIVTTVTVTVTTVTVTTTWILEPLTSIIIFINTFTITTTRF